MRTGFVRLVLLSLCVAAPSLAQNVVLNPGFETGTFASWTILGTNNTPVVNATSHTGSWAAQLGALSGSEPLGDSSFYQTVVVPATGSPHLTYYWNGTTADTITFDWQDVYVTDTSGAILATVMHNCSTTGGYVLVDYDMAAFLGQTVRIEFLVHEDGFGDDTGMLVDDVSVAQTTPVELQRLSVD